MEYRVEHDSMGEVRVPADKYWGAQTERSHNNFPIGVGIETMPAEIIHAFGILKKAAARANRALRPEKMTEEKLAAIEQAADEVISGQLLDNFPLVVWQTGSGTQSNMNSNEVIANRGNEIAGKKLLHPNDDINMSQSSNDTFPTAMHIAAVCALEDKVIPAIDTLTATFRRLEEENAGIVKSGRTHLQDATPISFPQEISGWRSSLERDKELLLLAVKPLKELALGGTAVGTGLNTPKGFDTAVAAEIAKLTGKDFKTAENKFHALTSKDEIVFAHGALKALAADSGLCERRDGHDARSAVRRSRALRRGGDGGAGTGRGRKRGSVRRHDERKGRGAGPDQHAFHEHQRPARREPLFHGARDRADFAGGAGKRDVRRDLERGKLPGERNGAASGRACHDEQIPLPRPPRIRPRRRGDHGGQDRLHRRGDELLRERGKNAGRQKRDLRDGERVDRRVLY